MVLRELAAFHASGHYFISTYPGGLDALAKEYPQTFTEDIFNHKEMDEEMGKQFFEMTSNCFGSCVLVAKKYGASDLGKRMESFHQKVKGVMEGFFTNKWKMRFVTHGDAWYNNFMYRLMQFRNVLTMKEKIYFEENFSNFFTTLYKQNIFIRICTYLYV
jgi:hypothetical protein